MLRRASSLSLASRSLHLYQVAEVVSPVVAAAGIVSAVAAAGILAGPRGDSAEQHVSEHPPNNQQRRYLRPDIPSPPIPLIAVP